MARNRGRDRRREARWRQIIREHGRSGLSIREFCRRGKLTETAFYFWRRELQRRQAEHVSGIALAKPEEQRCPADSPAFVAVRLTGADSTSADDGRQPPCDGRIVIELTDRRRVHLTGPVDRQALADVLAVLRLDEAASVGAEAEGRSSVASAEEAPPC